MSIISIYTDVAGQIGVKPRRVAILSSDNLATVTTAGYLNQANLQGYTIEPTDEICMWYGYSSFLSPGTFGIFTPDITNGGLITLNIWENPGNVLLPVVDGDFANFNGTTGQIEDAGYSPTDATKAKVAMLNAVPVVADNITTFSATNGTIKDSGTALSAVQLKAGIKAATTANIGGGGAGPISVAVTGLTAASVVVGTIESSTNPVQVQTITATATGFDVVFSGDPGASCLLNYIAFIAAQ